jgi:adenosine deaminase
LRHFTADESLATAELVTHFARIPGSRVASLDLAGDEAGFPLEPHVPAFALAAERGISRTAHAGEALGPESVRETLQRLSPARIGHGVRAAEDVSLVGTLASSRIHLEVCPSSNVQTNICETLAEHPIDRLVEAGVSLGISTDTRTVTDTTLVTEYRRLWETFGWTASDFLRCNREALEAAFAPEELKARLRAQLAIGYPGLPAVS